MNTLRLRTLIVDDDPNAILMIKKHITSFPFIDIVGEVNDGKAAMYFLRQNQIDLLFLDIEMNDINGLELAQHIQELYADIMIIFVTGHAGFALKGYEYQPVDFITKPIDFFRFEKTMAMVKERKVTKDVKIIPDAKIGMKVAGGIRMVQVSDISYIEKKGRKILIVGKDQEFFYSSDTMKNLENIFLSFDFFRVHQSFIIPIHHIKGIFPDTLTRSYTIQLDDNITIPLSRNKYKELKEFLLDSGISIY